MLAIIGLFGYGLTRWGTFGNNVVELNDSKKKAYHDISYRDCILFLYCEYWKDPKNETPCHKIQKFFIRPTWIYHNGVLQN